MKLESLKEDHRPLQVEHFGFVELRKVVFSSSTRDLIHLLGPAPTQQAMVSLGLTELQPILGHLQQSAPEEDEVRPVSGDKLNYNELPNCVETLLKAGMTKARILEEYFSRTHNKEKGICVTAAFRNEYSKLKSEGRGSVEIFDHLRSFAAGPYRTISEVGLPLNTYKLLQIPFTTFVRSRPGGMEACWLSGRKFAKVVQREFTKFFSMNKREFPLRL
jgi:hypothetical protein